MKDIIIEIGAKVFGKASVPLSILILGWLILSPSYNNIIQLMNKVEAHELKFDKLDVIDHKLNEIMLKLGIQEYRIDTIENRKPKKSSE